MARFNFNRRDRDAEHATPIYLIVRWNTKRLVYPSGERIEGKYWYKKFKKDGETIYETDQRARLNHPDREAFNEILDDIQKKAETVFFNFKAIHKREPEPSELKSELDKVFGRANEKEEVKLDLFGYLDQYIERSYTRVNGRTNFPIANGTIKRFRVLRTHLVGYKSASKKQIDFMDIDLGFYHEFKLYLEDKGLVPNTIGSIIKALKMVLFAAQDEEGQELHAGARSKSFRGSFLLTTQVALTEAELDEMYALDLSASPRLERVRDLFIVGAWTGLRFSDLSNLTPLSREGDALNVLQQKTKKKLAVTIRPVVDEIWKKYNGELPTGISNQKFNVYLKEVARMMPSLCKVENFKTSRIDKRTNQQEVERLPKWKKIGAHTGRRSFATNLYKRKEQILSIMAATGHKSMAAFLQYIRITPEEYQRQQQASVQEQVANLQVVNS